MKKRLISVALMGATAGLIPMLANSPAAHATCPPTQSGTPSNPAGVYYGTSSANGAYVGVTGNNAVAGQNVASGYVDVSSGQGVAAQGALANQPSGFVVVGPGGSGSSDPNVGCH